MTPATLHVRRRVDLQAVADRVALSGAPQAPLYAAVAAGEIALISISRPETQWPSETIANISRPCIVLLGGDPGFGERSFGPHDWLCSDPMRLWAPAAMVHGAAGDRDHYAAAIAIAMTLGRLALIETTSSLVPAWYHFMAPVPAICIVPPDGGIHPARPAALQ